MNTRLIPRGDVDAAREAAMYCLLDRHFLGVDREQFRADLAEKSWVVLLEDGRERLVGFSTLLLYEDDGNGRPGEPDTIVYSGDTIVDPDAWGSPTLARGWIRAVRELHERRGRRRLWWLLITSGFRTYRFLPVFCRRYHPQHGASSSAGLRARRDRLARARFGERYDASTGIVRLARPQRLRPALRELPEGRMDDPHVALFARLNPGHAEGDELACLAELGDANLTAAGLRMLYGAARRTEGGRRTSAAGRAETARCAG